MAKKAYIGIDGVARKLKKAYVGVDDVARRIKKAYIGIGGVARPCWSSGGELSYYGTLSNGLAKKARNLAATSVGSYALFGGGYTYSDSTYTPLSAVTAYNELLTRSIPSALAIESESLAATSVGNYALFGGGIYAYGDEYDHSAWTVTAYDSKLTKTIPESLDGGRSDLAATSVGNYALFGGGMYNPNSEYVDTVDAYDTSLTKNANVPQLAYARGRFTAVTVGGHALFPNGRDNTKFSSSVTTIPAQFIETYNASLTRGYMECPISRWDFAATSVGNYALIGGGIAWTLDEDGKSTNGSTDVVHAIDKSLTLSIPSSLSSRTSKNAAASVNGYALFGGYSITDVYDDSLTHTTTDGLSQHYMYSAATSVGNYVLFGGGGAVATGNNVVNAYQVI